MPSPPSRAWRAACPNCGAPVEFASAASASAVCGYCRSTLLRDGDALKRIGRSAELFDDHSPLQLGAAGSHLGAAFTVVGRQQLDSDGGRWSEWHVLFDGDGAPRSGWLSEDNGAYVMAFDAPLAGPVPEPGALRPGEPCRVGGADWSVASVVRARVLAAEGELPEPPRLDGPPFVVADLRRAADEVATLDWRDPARVAWSVGRPVRLAELRMTGLRDASAQTVAGRTFACPSCGASLTPTLATTRSLACAACHAVVDVSQGIGGELAHYAQDNPGLPPQIPLGRTGTLRLGAAAALPWQVVGYVERIEVDVEAGEAQAAWREYLLYHAQEGFAFLVDAEDGWSWARPLTGAPTLRGDRAEWQGTTYRKLYAYDGAVTYVLGEFYWRLERGERTRNVDFAAGTKRLNREQTGDEVTWSAGETLDAATVAKAFGLDAAAAGALQRDVAPWSSDAGGPMRKLVVYALVTLAIVVLLNLARGCSSDECAATRTAFGEASNEYRQCLASQRFGGGVRGGSFGGFSSGGGHK